MVLAMSAVQAQTVVNSTWSGGGLLTFNSMATGSTTSGLSTSGNTFNGSASFTNNGPTYGVDNTLTQFSAVVGSGGNINSTVNRTGSYVSGGYGAAGQSITSYAGSSGSAALVTNATVNYASLYDNSNNLKTTAGNTLEASGTSFGLGYQVDSGVANNIAGFSSVGSGSGAVNMTGSGANYSSTVSLGNGIGHYTQANYAYTGTGTFNYGGIATHSLTVLGSNNTLPGTVESPASVSVVGSYTGAGTWTNFALSGNK